MVRLTGIAALAASVETFAFAFAGPKATDVAVIPSDAWSPRPTPPPRFHDLIRRAAATTETYLVAPDNTCGYVSGRAGAAYTCNGLSDLCVFATPSADVPGLVGCCNDDACGFRVDCFDFDQVSSQSLCDNGCLQDTFTVKCTESTARFCNTVSFPGSITDYFCNSLNISTTQLALTTYSGETDGRTFSDLIFTTSSAPRAAASTALSSGSGSSAAAGASPSSTTPASSSSSSSSNAGAIAGGVVGGVAVIGLIVLGVVFLLRHNKRQREQDQPPAATPLMMQPRPSPPPQPGYPPSMGQPSPGGHQSYYGMSPPTDLNDPNKLGMQQPIVQPYPAASPPPQQQYEHQQYAQGYGQTYPNGQLGVAPTDRLGATSPGAMSQMTTLYSAVGPSPATSVGYPPQMQHQQAPPPQIYEMGADNRYGQTHELA